jgi:SPP1 gp7 family putative phage head morphogenesis protein
MKLSKTTRKDPTQSKTLRESYRRDLIRLFASYRRDALVALKQSTDPTARMMAAADIDLIGLDEQLRGLGAALVTKGVPITREHVISNYTAGTGFGTKQLNRIGVEAVIGEGPADWRVIDSLKVRNLTALRGVSDEMNKQIIRELSDGIQKGESMPKLAKRISGRVDSIGKTRATTMARTETLTAFNQGAELRYSQAGVETLQWLSAHDPPRVCEECLALDGTTFRVKSNHPRPPIHPNCRCTVIPVLGKPKLVSKEDSVRNLTDKIDVTREGATAARREFTSVRNWNAKWRDDIRTGMKLAPEQMHKAWTGKTASVADLKKMRVVLADAERRKAHFLTRQEIALTGKWGKKKGFADKITKEIALSGRLNRYDIELDDLLMELRAVKKGRHLGLKSAVTKYEKRVYARPGEELYIIDKNGQRIYYNSFSEAGSAGFTDIRGVARGGAMVVNQADGTLIMIDDYVRQAAKLNLAEVRMVADDRVHILRRTGKWDEKYYADTIAPAYRKAKRDLKRELVDAGKENRIGTEWYDWQAWKRAAVECDEIEYDRATPSPLIPRKKLSPHERDLLKAEAAMREEKRLKDFLRSIAGE